MQLNKEMRMSVALACAAALASASLVVHAECGNTGPSGNDAEVVCHNCATDAWSTGSCTWHEAEAIATFLTAAQVLLLHDPGDAVASMAASCFAQLFINARSA